MKCSVRLLLEKCANYEGEDRGQGKNSGRTLKESLFHNSVGGKVPSAEPCWPAKAVTNPIVIGLQQGHRPPNPPPHPPFYSQVFASGELTRGEVEWSEDMGW